MSQVLSLIAADAKGLGAGELERARRALDQVSVGSGEPECLAPSQAIDIPFDGLARQACDAVRAAFAGQPIDINVVPIEFRRKRLLIADMDSTIIRQECIDELAAEVGMRDEVAAITERAMRGELDFAAAVRERVALLQGLEETVVEGILADRIELTPGARTLVATMRAAGAHTALVSGGFTSFVEPIGAMVGFHETRANLLLCDDGLFTGLVAEPILGADAKVEALAELGTRFGLRPQETIAVGDGANDAAMIARAGLGVGFHPKPTLRRVAHATIDHADLTALLFLQGFRRDEFVETA